MDRERSSTTYTIVDHELTLVVTYIY
ncbi:hypothetical protein CCACVL1_23248 [Corchorus capsularis]|uniref:Uncharacterized protein n=1 Tax=Corchorus capsularis TaxID=210143 RepID=A0A1R3GUR8_COCAP|nr:hypothetical protein CCACVL1_23248 [Corchorus capsularis]